MKLEVTATAVQQAAVQECTASRQGLLSTDVQTDKQLQPERKELSREQIELNDCAKIILRTSK